MYFMDIGQNKSGHPKKCSVTYSDLCIKDALYLVLDIIVEKTLYSHKVNFKV